MEGTELLCQSVDDSTLPNVEHVTVITNQHTAPCYHLPLDTSTVLTLTTQYAAPSYHLPLDTSTVLPLTTQYAAPSYYLPLDTAPTIYIYET